MSFTKENVNKVANLARIAITDEEGESLVSELGSIFDWVEQLSEVDVSDVEAVTSVSGEEMPFRKDEVTAGNQLEDVLQNAPAKEFNCFVVPKVIDQG
jgi:aspartyl-tRNA(Asn)/glutamyl-tRNA(Gln) amidotransferase subunit C